MNTENMMYTCALCGKSYTNIIDRMACEQKCYAKQQEEAKKAASLALLEEERKKLKEQLKDEKEAQSQIETTKSMIKNLREVWNYMAFNEQRLIIEHLVEKIVIDDNKISIYYQLK